MRELLISVLSTYEYIDLEGDRDFEQNEALHAQQINGVQINSFVSKRKQTA